MGRKSNFLADKILNLIFGGTGYTPPATLYFAFFTDSNTEDQRAAGTFTEVAFSNGYVRKAVTNNVTNFPNASGGVITINSVEVAARVKTVANDIVWDAATGTWGTIRAWAIFDAATGGNLLEFTAVGTPQQVVAGNIPFISAATGFNVSER